MVCTQPDNAREAFNSVRGFDISGNPIVNPLTGKATKFWHPDDPVAGTGWIDSLPSERYFLMSSGPFVFAAGDTQEVALAIIIAQGSTGLASVQRLKQNVLLAQTAYREQMQELLTNGPAAYALEQNYPNPFNAGTTFDFTLHHDEQVSLKIYNLSGEEVAVVVKENLVAGRYKRKWSSAGLPSGIYFYRFQAGAFVQTRKLTVLK